MEATRDSLRPDRAGTERRRNYADNGRQVGYNNGPWQKPLPMSYGENATIYLRPPGNPTPLSLAVITFPAESYWIADIHGNHPVGFHADNTGGLFGPNTFNRVRFSRPCAGMIDTGGRVGLPANHPNPGECARHQEGNTFVFCDGHAKWERWNQSQPFRANPTRTTP